jgi:hypothetical protein
MMREAADLMVQTGMADVGYAYVNPTSATGGW